MDQVLCQGRDINTSEQLAEGATTALISQMRKLQLGKIMENSAGHTGRRNGISTSV